MDTSQPAEIFPICSIDTDKKATTPLTFVIFGASGDLTARKLVPALFCLWQEKRLPQTFRIVGVARRDKTDALWASELFEAVKKFCRKQDIHSDQWEDFAKNLSYCCLDYLDRNAYEKLALHIANFKKPELQKNLVFYLATPPSQFVGIVKNLCYSGLLCRCTNGPHWQRLVVEKPFGHDLQSAKQISESFTQFIEESQVFRIDHYLGKETVQNLLVFRFANSLFEPLWNRLAIDHVQITVSEQHSVGSRGGYYEETGALRDMIQNHLMQILAMIAMEPPSSLDSESIRDEKVKVLKAIRPFNAQPIQTVTARGQYTAGMINGKTQIAYRQEDKVNPQSNVETFAAIKVIIDNWRWAGIPFYLRTGKCLPINASEIIIQFRLPPETLFAAKCGPKLDPNSITIRLQPEEGIHLKFSCKIPGIGFQLRPVRMAFNYKTEFGAYTPEAYERLLLDAIIGDTTLFIRRDELETAWALVDPIYNFWRNKPLDNSEFYPAGTWGPKTSDQLLANDNRSWINPTLESPQLL